MRHARNKAEVQADAAAAAWLVTILARGERSAGGAAPPADRKQPAAQRKGLGEVTSPAEAEDSAHPRPARRGGTP
jgi:hypothetical protein